MEKVTKKEFKQLHSENRLGLIQGGIHQSIASVCQAIDNAINKNIDFELLKTSRVDLDNQGDYIKVQVYHFQPGGTEKHFYIVEDTIDNSKSMHCSWDTVDYSCNVYQLRG